MDTLEDLRRIIRRLETAPPLRSAPEPPHAVLGGEVLDTEDGALVVVRRRYPLTHCHGHRRLTGAFALSPEVLGLLGRPGEPPIRAEPLVFLDVETTGLAGGTGTYAFLVGVGFKEGDHFAVCQYLMRDLDEEPALLAALAPILERASAIVTFNGSGFDLPLLETRFILARRRWSSTLAQLDLLRPARRVWSSWLPDCRLTTLERTVLGHERSDDVPGWMIPVTYFEFLRSRRAGPLARVLDHNRGDVLALVALLAWFGAAVGADDVPLRAEEMAGLGRLWETVDRDRSRGWYERALAAGLVGPPAQAVRIRLAWWEKRRARWDSACALWKEASQMDAFDPRPWEELAKFHEHRRRDAAAARALVLTALGLARNAAVTPRVIEAFTHRLGRLERRLGAQSRLEMTGGSATLP